MQPLLAFISRVIRRCLIWRSIDFVTNAELVFCRHGARSVRLQTLPPGLVLIASRGEMSVGVNKLSKRDSTLRVARCDSKDNFIKKTDTRHN
jgi:hypothetical protein